MAELRLRADPAERIRRPPQHGPRRRGVGRVILRGSIKAVVLLLLWTTIIGGGVLGYFALTLPDTSQLTVAERRPSVTILAADGSLLATFGDLFGQPLTLQEMSPLSAEGGDRDRGPPLLQPFRRRSDRAAARRGRQSARRARRPGRQHDHPAARQEPVPDAGAQPARKIRETLLALWLEHRFTKDEILEIYLNRVYLGAGTYGVDAAAHRYFGKSARQAQPLSRAPLLPAC